MFEKPVFLYILILESKRKLVNVKKKKQTNSNSRAIQFIKTELRGFTKSANGKKKNYDFFIN